MQQMTILVLKGLLINTQNSVSGIVKDTGHV